MLQNLRHRYQCLCISLHGHEEKCINIDIDVLDFEAIKQFILDHSVSLVVVGPEDPLVQGIKDYLIGCDVMVFGPDSVAAQLEGPLIALQLNLVQIPSHRNR